MRHYDDDSLLEYVEGLSPHAGEIESHVNECPFCATEVARNREVVSSLRSAEVWTDAPEATEPPRQFVANVTAFAERARLEEERAVALCDEILSGPPAW